LRDPASPADVYWQNLLTESIDATRTMLQHAARQSGLRVVMVTSALGGEGKTSLASHLATSLARAGCRTLLIDGDLRRPVVHRLFDVDGTPGLSEVLRGEAAVEDAVSPTPVDSLWILPAGAYDGQTLQVLARGGARPVLDA